MSPPLPERLQAWSREAAERVARVRLGPGLEEAGRLERLGDGVAWVSGLPGLRLDEVVVFESGAQGLAVDLERERVGCVALGSLAGLSAGSRVVGTGGVLEVPTGDALLGRVVDPLGRPLDELGPLQATSRAPVEREAPGVVDREPVRHSLHTGVTALDALLPIGRGQRELILGDRASGKTSLALDAMLAQRDSDVVCVYAAIGQKSSAVASVIAALRARARFERCVVVVAAPDAPLGLQWLAPFAACSIAEHWSERGGHALLVLDDLSKHARVHRQLSLLLRRPPGREAYPGDVFYLHARLLERAARLSAARGGGSLTALPIAETEAGDLAAYIPTNLISITDGQVYLEPRLFHEGFRPAIDVGKSVSRVGARSQPPALRSVSEQLKLDYAQFLELEVFARFGGELDDHARAALERGWRVREVLIQGAQRPLRVGQQVAILTALGAGLLDGVPAARVAAVRDALPAWLAAHAPELAAELERGEPLGEARRQALLATLRELIAARAGAAT